MGCDEPLAASSLAGLKPASSRTLAGKLSQDTGTYVSTYLTVHTRSLPRGGPCAQAYRCFQNMQAILTRDDVKLSHCTWRHVTVGLHNANRGGLPSLAEPEGCRSFGGFHPLLLSLQAEQVARRIAIYHKRLPFTLADPTRVGQGA